MVREAALFCSPHIGSWGLAPPLPAPPPAAAVVSAAARAAAAAPQASHASVSARNTARYSCYGTTTPGAARVLDPEVRGLHMGRGGGSLRLVYGMSSAAALRGVGGLSPCHLAHGGCSSWLRMAGGTSPSRTWLLLPGAGWGRGGGGNHLMGRRTSSSRVTAQLLLPSPAQAPPQRGPGLAAALTPVYDLMTWRPATSSPSPEASSSSFAAKTKLSGLATCARSPSGASFFLPYLWFGRSEALPGPRSYSTSAARTLASAPAPAPAPTPIPALTPMHNFNVISARARARTSTITGAVPTDAPPLATTITTTPKKRRGRPPAAASSSASTVATAAGTATSTATGTATRKRAAASKASSSSSSAAAPAAAPKRRAKKAPAELSPESSPPAAASGPARGPRAPRAAARGTAAGAGAGGATRAAAAKWVVVVESPAKAGSIGAYLGPGFRVLASYGHVRDLPSRVGSVQPERQFAMTWQVSPRAKPHLSALADAVRGAGGLVLATDPDREGEAIAWHVQEALREEGVLTPGMEVRRVCFNEITRGAVESAMAQPREISPPLVEAYLARRALDYLMGFQLSPILWRKLPGSRSAGRVQSVALKFVCERELAIEAFRPQEYWSIHATLQAAGGESFAAQLTHLDGVKLGVHGITSEDDAKLAARRIAGADLTVASVKTSEVRRNPSPPYTTSTLQQDASSRLGFSIAKTMMAAQKLYEGVQLQPGSEPQGLITYMRTDSVQLSDDAVADIRSTAAERYGREYVAAEARQYKTATKNAQEAHEAIRPTDMRRLPSSLVGVLESSVVRLYGLIWGRTMACQMSCALLSQVSAGLESRARDVRLSATGSSVAFSGYLAALQDKACTMEGLAGEEEEEAEEGAGRTGARTGGGGGGGGSSRRGAAAPITLNNVLVSLKEGEPVTSRQVDPKQHFTQAPPRFTEGTLVRRMEEAGIGRPSTYAVVIKTLQARAYVRLESRRMVPELRGRLVTTFLQKYFPQYVDSTFTANMEAQLDEVSGGRAEWKALLTDFWTDFSPAVSSTFGVPPDQVSAVIEEELGDLLFAAPSEEHPEPRKCPSCGGRLGLQFTRHAAGIFIGCTAYPDCSYKTNVVAANGSGGDSGGAPRQMATRDLGVDPTTGLQVSLRQGPYGPYVQMEGKGKSSPRRAKLPPDTDMEQLDLPAALRILAPTPPLGEHPDGGPVEVGRGPFGYYLKHGTLLASIPKGLAPEEVTLEQAVAILAAKEAKQKLNPRYAAKATKAKAAKKEKPEKPEKPAKSAKKRTSASSSSSSSRRRSLGEEEEEEREGEGEGEGVGKEAVDDVKKRTKRRAGGAKKEATEEEEGGAVYEAGSSGNGAAKERKTKKAAVKGVKEPKVPKGLKKEEGAEEGGKKRREVSKRASPQLASFLGGVEEVKRTEAISRVWAYVKLHNLQDPSDGRVAILDEKLRELLGVEQVKLIGISKCLTPHLSEL